MEKEGSKKVRKAKKKQKHDDTKRKNSRELYLAIMAGFTSTL